MTGVTCPTCRSPLGLRDLARLADVSEATIQRYAKNPLALRATTRKRIERAAAKVARTAMYIDEMAKLAKSIERDQKNDADYARHWIEFGRIHGGS